MSNRITPLDGLRGFAILLVILDHGYQAIQQQLPNWFDMHAAPFFQTGSLGVRLFFVLSGFLITYLLLKEQSQTNQIKLGAFFRRRISRILPAYLFFMLVIGLLITTGTLKIAWEQYLPALAFLSNYAPLWLAGEHLPNQWYLAHTWTLGVEIQFYLLWPFVLITCPKNILKWILLILACGMPFIRLISYFLFEDQRGYLGIMFHCNLDGVMLGAAVALWKDQLPSLIHQWTHHRLVPMACVGFLTIISPLLADHISGYHVTIGYFAQAFCSSLILLNALAYPERFNVLHWRPLVITGLISYSLYLWQQLFFSPLNTHVSGQIPWNLMITFLIAFLSWKTIENTGRHLLAPRGKTSH